MFSIKCDDCGYDLYINYDDTTRLYMKNSESYRLFNDGILDESVIPNYIVFECSKCHNKFNFNYRDWESRYRRDLAMRIMEIKKREAFKHLNPDTVKESSGIEFCGQCIGSESNGNCLVDIIKQCSVRK